MGTRIVTISIQRLHIDITGITNIPGVTVHKSTIIPVIGTKWHALPKG
jgi:hypothetical protein